MKQIIILLLLFVFVGSAVGQVRPDQQNTKTPELTDAIYTQESGELKKVLFSAFVDWIIDNYAQDTSLTNEIQSLTYSNDTLSLSGGNSVVIEAGVDSSLISTNYRRDTAIQAVRNEKLSVEIDGDISNELQVLDVAQLVGTDLQLSLSNDGEATKEIDLSSLAGGGGVSDGDKGDITVTTLPPPTSLTFWTIDNGAVKTESLQGGEASPIANQFYGTDSTGTKGFHSIDTIGTIGKVFRSSSDSMFLQAPTLWLSNSTQEVLSVDTDGVKILNGTGNNGATVLYGKDPITSKIVEVSDLTGFTGVGGGGGGGGGGAADSITFSTNYRRDTAIANVRAEMFLNSVIVAGEGSYYHSNGADFSVPNGSKDAQVYIQQAADLAVSRGVSIVLMDGLFTVNDSVSILPTYNITFSGTGKENTIIYTDSIIWLPSTPVFGFDIDNDTLNYIEFRDFSIRQPTNGNVTTIGKGGLIRQFGNGHIEKIRYEGLDFRGSGGFGLIINHTYFNETAGNYATLGEIEFQDCYFEIDGVNSLGGATTGQYVVRTKIPVRRIMVDNCVMKIANPEAATGGNNYNVMAAYGMSESVSILNSDFICETYGHSPLATSPGKNVRYVNNYVYMKGTNGDEGLIEIERKLTHVPTSLIDTVQNFTIVGNVAEWGDGAKGGTWYGIIITDRDGVQGGAYIPVQHGSVTGNSIRKAKTGILAGFSNNVVVSSNAISEYTTRVDWGRTDLGDATLGETEILGITIDGANESLKMYDNSALVSRTFLRQGDNPNEFHYGSIDTILVTDESTSQVLIGTQYKPIELSLIGRIEFDNAAGNVSIGKSTPSILDGSHQISIGDRAGNTAPNQVNIGYQAGNVITGGYGVLVGYGAGQNITTGGSNNFIGYLAGGKTTVGENNIGIGTLALEANISGSNNVAVGRDAGKNTTSSDNVILGFGALKQNATGAQNTIIGNSAVLGSGGINIGNNNVTLGYISGKLLGVGSANNTLLGAFTGPQAGLVAVSNNVLIGYQVGQNNTADNRLMIDNTNTETPLIDGDFANDIVTINSILNIAPITAATASAITPANGMYIYVSNTNATFTTIGFWAYENGSWVDK